MNESPDRRTRLNLMSATDYALNYVGLVTDEPPQPVRILSPPLFTSRVS
jgi:hypothetical protein